MSAPGTFIQLVRRPTANGVAELRICDSTDPNPDHDIVIPLWPAELRKLAVQAIEALEPLPETR
jgi:hypothetical protein